MSCMFSIFPQIMVLGLPSKFEHARVFVSVVKNSKLNLEFQEFKLELRILGLTDTNSKDNNIVKLTGLLL